MIDAVFESGVVVAFIAGAICAFGEKCERADNCIVH